MATLYRPGMLRGAGKAVALADAIDRGTQAVTDFQQGDNLMGGYNALRAGAGVMAARGNPVAAAFVGGSMAGDLIGKALPEDVRMRIGAATNAVVRKAGDLVGQKWGVDDSALTDGPGASNTTRSPLKAPQAGRSTVLDTTNYKAPDSPSASAFDRTNDVRTAINTGQIPDSLRDGRIWSAGNMYVGKDVRFGAPFVDARTGMNRDSKAAVSVLPSNSEAVSSSALRTPQANEFGRPTTPTIPLSDQKLREDIYRQLARQPREPSYRYRARIGALVDYLNSVAASENNYRDAVVRQAANLNDNFTSRANNIDNNSTARRGQNMELEGRLLPKQMELEQMRRMRELQATIFQQAGGDARKAAALAAASGMPEMAKSFYDLAEGAQKYSQGAGKSALESLKAHATPDEKGNITEAEEAKLLRRVESALPGYRNMSETERLANQADADGVLSILGGINALRNNRFSQYIGLDGPDPEVNRLPALNGGKLGEVGFWEGLMTPEVGRNDYYVELPSGQKVYIPRESLTENAVDVLKKQGVEISPLRK